MKSLPSRRGLFRRARRVIGSAGLVGASLVTAAAFLERRDRVALATRGGLGILRPPGSLDEDEFLARCIRCTRCADACKPGAIRLLPAGAGSSSGSPYIVAEERACHLCLACGEVCPTGAIESLERIEDARMGVAVVDERLCVSHNGTGVCGACHTVCPLKNRAITQNYRNAPEVHAEACVGCGLCEEACIVDDRKAIQVFTPRAADERRRR